jgi:hypothetical protein
VAQVFGTHNLRATRVRYAYDRPGVSRVRRCGSRDSEAWVSGVRFALLGTLMLADGAGDPVVVSGVLWVPKTYATR